MPDTAQEQPESAHETWISVDIETYGLQAGKNPMISLGAAAGSASAPLISTFQANLTIPDCYEADPDTLTWWEQFPEVHEDCRRSPVPPEEVMKSFAAWVRFFDRPVFLAWPTSFDYPFVDHYLRVYAGMTEKIFRYSLCIRSYVAAVLGWDVSQVSTRTVPDFLRSERAHTHRAIDDAIQQLEVYQKARELARRRAFDNRTVARSAGSAATVSAGEDNSAAEDDSADEDARILRAVRSGRCQCGGDIDIISMHERDSSNDVAACSRCKWSYAVSYGEYLEGLDDRGVPLLPAPGLCCPR